MYLTAVLLAIVTSFFTIIILQWAIRRHRAHQFFKKYGIPGPKPSFLAGNMFHLKKKLNAFEVMSVWIKTYGNVLGFYMGDVPFLIVNDVEALKQVLIKDFQYFTNRPRMAIDVPPLDKSLMTLQGQKWKEHRAILSPSFTSGKMKLMANVMQKKVDILAGIVAEKVSKNEMFDIHQMAQGLTLDVIAACALAMKTRCQEDPNDSFLHAVRYYMHNQTNFGVEAGLIFPTLSRVAQWASRRFQKVGHMTDIVLSHVHASIALRRNEPSSRSIDLLQLMLDSRENAPEDSKKMTDEEIAASAYLFLIAGYETTSIALGFTFYLLATHPEVQERLYKEISRADDNSYSSVQGLTYLDQVFNESLRIYPPVPFFNNRTCDKDYKIGSYTIPKGANVVSPVWDIHHDSDLWPDPWRFDPDRFSSENKSSINSMAFQPFGAGPRNCIGSRFAQLNAKLTIFDLVKRFKFETCAKTDHPVTVESTTFVIEPSKGVWLKAVARS